ncbi:hypothetical protein ACFSBZ_06515 [Amnibacterium flavum]|uniref:Sugar ABC transporter substrate-binding protein n=1 Tax=Amnibacterium flavum TaxID=2173173 RepID=A0A2V1HN37_9MICO|nr:hypothetical protein [Amnibacterium flavum]PVZ93895.1 hypothetical protein DDQ50_08975 [Amnibacterium flavum]
MTQNGSNNGRGGRLARRGALSALALTAAALLASCSATGATEGAAGGSGGSDSGEVVIGYSTYTVANPAFAGIIQGQKEEAEKNGYKFISTNANLDPNQQISDVQ